MAKQGDSLRIHIHTRNLHRCSTTLTPATEYLNKFGLRKSPQGTSSVGVFEVNIDQGRKVDIRPGINLIERDGTARFDLEGQTNINPNRHNQMTTSKATTAATTTTLKPDVILFATGYRYCFPFLDASKILNDQQGTKGRSSHDDDGTIKNQVVRHRYDVTKGDGYKMKNLYRRCLYVHDPSLGFIGITNLNLSPCHRYGIPSSLVCSSFRRDGR